MKEGTILESGEIEWSKTHQMRMDIKLKNKPCLDCSILPICGGGCRQVGLEKRESYCLYDFDERKKKQVVLDILTRESYNFINETI